MTEIYRINTNNPIPYSEATIHTSGTFGLPYHPVPITNINISDIQDKYNTSFKDQPPNTGA
jgi:hypothetical protein